MRIFELLQTDEMGNKDISGIFLDENIANDFEEYINKYQKYNFYIEECLVDNVADYLKTIKTVLKIDLKYYEYSAYLTDYVGKHYLKFLTTYKGISK